MKLRPTWSDRLASRERSSSTAELTAPALRITSLGASRFASPRCRYSTATIRPVRRRLSDRVTSAPVSSVTFGCLSASAIPTLSASLFAPVVSGKASQGVAARFSQPFEVEPERQ